MAIGIPALGTPAQDTVASTSSTPAYPSVTTNALMCLLGATGSGAANPITTPATWTLDQQTRSTGDTVAPTIYAAHKLSAGTETGTLTVNHGSTITSLGIVVMSGVDTTTPVDSTTLVDITTGSTTWALPSLSVTNAGSTLLYVASANNTTSNFTPPSGYTELWDGVPNLAASRSWSIGYQQNVSAGATGTSSMGVTNNVKGLVVLYVINPTPAASMTFIKQVTIG